MLQINAEAELLYAIAPMSLQGKVISSDASLDACHSATVTDRHLKRDPCASFATIKTAHVKAISFKEKMVNLWKPDKVPMI